MQQIMHMHIYMKYEHFRSHSFTSLKDDFHQDIKRFSSFFMEHFLEDIAPLKKAQSNSFQEIHSNH